MQEVKVWDENPTPFEGRGLRGGTSKSLPEMVGKIRPESKILDVVHVTASDHHSGSVNRI